ncbi:hypothetical protein ACFL6S_23100 [Candidatus Poribacteria bacterium]
MYQKGLSGRPAIILTPEQLLRRILKGPAYSFSDYIPTIKKVSAKPIDYRIGIYESKIPTSSMEAENAYSQKQEADQAFSRTPEPVEPASQPFVPESRITKYDPEVDRIFIDMALDGIDSD